MALLVRCAAAVRCHARTPLSSPCRVDPHASGAARRNGVTQRVPAMVQLSALQKKALLAAAAALLAVALAPWPEAQHAAAPQQPRSKCPAGFSSGGGGGGELPAGHPPVASAAAAYAEPPYATGLLTFDPPAPLPPPSGAPSRNVAPSAPRGCSTLRDTRQPLLSHVLTAASPARATQRPSARCWTGCRAAARRRRRCWSSW